MPAPAKTPVFAIGVTGHRLNRLPEQGRPTVEAEIGGLLDLALAASRAAPRPLRLTLVSGLAEGADRMAAEAALARGLALHAILPFEAGEYEKDFEEPGSKASFRALLANAAGVEALPGHRADAEAAYEAAGIAMLKASDILIAVWDGGPSAGRGGTTEMVAAARARGLPVLWVDSAGARAAAPYDGTAKSCDDAIASAIARVLGTSI